MLCNPLPYMGDMLQKYEHYPTLFAILILLLIQTKIFAHIYGDFFSALGWMLHLF